MLSTFHSVAPTPAVTIEKWENVGCPEDYDGSATYDANSIVALTGVVYQCKPHVSCFRVATLIILLILSLTLRLFNAKTQPDTGFCKMHNPDSEWGYLGWKTLGSCTGTRESFAFHLIMQNVSSVLSLF